MLPFCVSLASMPVTTLDLLDQAFTSVVMLASMPSDAWVGVSVLPSSVMSGAFFPLESAFVQSWVRLVQGMNTTKTKVKVVFIPWTNRTQDWTNALSSGKNAPDITELGNTDTPTQASLGMLANITTDVNAWSNKSNVVTGMLANDTQNGSIYAVPWFGGVRGIWYRTDQFKAAGIASPPTTWAQLVTDAKKLMAKYPG